MDLSHLILPSLPRKPLVVPGFPVRADEDWLPGIEGPAPLPARENRLRNRGTL